MNYIKPILFILAFAVCYAFVLEILRVPEFVVNRLNFGLVAGALVWISIVIVKREN